MITNEPSWADEVGETRIDLVPALRVLADFDHLWRAPGEHQWGVVDQKRGSGSVAQNELR